MCLFTSISLLLLTIFSQTPTTFGLTITFLAIILLLNTIFPSLIISCFSSSSFHPFIFTPVCRVSCFYSQEQLRSSLSSSNSYAASLCFCHCLVNSHTERHVNINTCACTNEHTQSDNQSVVGDALILLKNK